MKPPPRLGKLHAVKGRKKTGPTDPKKKSTQPAGKQKLLQQLVKAQENSEQVRVLEHVARATRPWGMNARLVRDIGTICWSQNRRLRELEGKIVRERGYVNNVLQESMRRGIIPTLTVRTQVKRKLHGINQKMAEGRKIIHEAPEKFQAKFKNRAFADALWQELHPHIFGSYRMRFIQKESNPIEG